MTALLKVHKQIPTLDLCCRIDTVRLELNLCLTAKAQKHLCWTNANFYHQANHPENLLMVLKEFQEFYEKLYQDPQPSGQQDINSFISNLPILSFLDVHWKLLDGDITLSEVLQAIKQTKIAKALGPDGFTALLY